MCVKRKRETEDTHTHTHTHTHTYTYAHYTTDKGLAPAVIVNCCGAGGDRQLA